MSNVYSLHEYAKAKQIAQDTEHLQKILDNQRQVLYGYKRYQHVQNIIAMIDEAKACFNVLNTEYSKIVKNKGKFIE